MQRGSDKHSPRLDDDLKEDFEPDERADRATRAHEWRDPETPGDELDAERGEEFDEAIDSDVGPESDTGPV